MSIKYFIRKLFRKNLKVGDYVICLEDCKGATYKKESYKKGDITIVSPANDNSCLSKESGSFWLSDTEGLFHKKYFKKINKL